MKHIIIRKNIYKFKRPKKIDPKEFESTEMDNHWLKIDNKKKTFI